MGIFSKAEIQIGNVSPRPRLKIGSVDKRSICLSEVMTAIPSRTTRPFIEDGYFFESRNSDRKCLTKAKTENWISGQTFDLFVGSHDGYSQPDNSAIHRRWVFFRKPKFRSEMSHQGQD